MMKNLPDWNTLQVGDELPALELPPLTRHTLALYCGASGDHNPIHVDIDFARAAGMPDVFAHGMLSMAWLARLLTNWVAQDRIREYGVRFVAITQVGDAITCSGSVTEVYDVNGERRARLALQTTNQHGQIKLSGDAEYFYVARRGEAYVTGMQASNKLALTWKNQQCSMDVVLPKAANDEIARVGPLLCKGVNR